MQPTKRKQKALDFVSSGISCNCLVTLSGTPYWQNLASGFRVDRRVFNTLPHPASVSSAIEMLIHSGVLIEKNNEIELSELGSALAEYIGLIVLLFDGYGMLMGAQSKISSGTKIPHIQKLLNGKAIADASIQFGEATVDPIVMEIFSSLEFSGTICDLGCGFCTRLSNICEVTHHPGLGFEYQTEVVKAARKHLKKHTCATIDVQQGDITSLNGIWEDVVIAMQYFVFHDFTPDSCCIQMLNSYLKNFPSLKYFFYVDIVAPSKAAPNIMPGYDYVHGLMNIKTRTYEETMSIFEQSNYVVNREIKIPGLPNTFLWILSPDTTLN